MRLFLIGWGDYVPAMITVVEELQKRSYQIVYWTRSNVNFSLDHSRFPSTIFHETEAALALKSAPGVDSTGFEPPSASLIAELYELESAVLTNMNKKFENVSHTERKRVYYQLVRYWYGVLRKFTPNAVIFGFIPHTVYDYIIYELARRLKIKVIVFNETMIEDWILVTGDFKAGYPKLRAEMERRASEAVSVNDLSADMQAYYYRKTDRKRDATPGYMLKDYTRFSGWNLLKRKGTAVIASFKDLSIFRKIFKFLYKTARRADLKSEYIRVQSEPDWNRKFVYVALNYQPECTTSPQGGVFVDQILMIETLSAALPDDWIIYVKEHPYQWMPRGANFSPYRYPGFYEAIIRIPKTRLVPPATSSYALTDRAQAVVTVTGTPGWEAILRGKPAIVFGFPWYQDYPALFKVRSVEECRIAIQKIQDGFVINEQTTLRFLRAVETIGLRAHIDIYTESVTSLRPEENSAAVFAAFLKALDISE